MVYYNFKKHKEFFYLDLFVYLIPISIVLGNLIVNIVSFLCILIYLSLFIKKKNLYENYKGYFNLFYFLIVFFILNLFISSNFQLTVNSVFGFIRYYLLFLIILYCLNEIDGFKIIFSKIIFILVVFIAIDILIQNFFLVDLFGYKIEGSHGRRLSGPFGDEKVAGSYIAKLFYLSCIFLINKKFKNYILFIILFLIFVVILTNERSASIMFLSGSLIFFIFCDIKFWKKIILFFVAIISLLILFNFNNSLRSHFIEIPLKYFKDNHHKAHYLTAYEIFKDNKLLGSGVKTFRYICKDKKYEKINSKYVDKRCATHPHNIYLEILSETGILGLSIILIINFYITFILIINFLKNKFLRGELLFLFCNFFILFWPLQTTGAFFSTWNGIFYWIFFSYFLV